MKVSIQLVDDLAIRHLLSPLLNTLMTFIRSSCLMILKEGLPTSTLLSANIIASNHSSASQAPGSGSGSGVMMDCSKTIQQLCKQIPDMARVYLLHLPKFPAVVATLEEFYQRVVMGYISIVALVRPVNEPSR